MLVICNKSDDPWCPSEYCGHREPHTPNHVTFLYLGRRHKHSESCTLWDRCFISKSGMRARCINVESHTGRQIVSRVFGRNGSDIIERYKLMYFSNSESIIRELIDTLEDTTINAHSDNMYDWSEMQRRVNNTISKSRKFIGDE